MVDGLRPTNDVGHLLAEGALKQGRKEGRKEGVGSCNESVSMESFPNHDAVYDVRNKLTVIVVEADDDCDMLVFVVERMCLYWLPRGLNFASPQMTQVSTHRFSLIVITSKSVS